MFSCLIKRDEDMQLFYMRSSSLIKQSSHEKEEAGQKVPLLISVEKRDGGTAFPKKV